MGKKIKKLVKAQASIIKLILLVDLGKFSIEVQKSEGGSGLIIYT